MPKTVWITAGECKTRQAEVFRQAAAGERIVVTRNGVPHVEIRKAPVDDQGIPGAVHALAELQRSQLTAGLTGSAPELRRLQQQGRD